MSEHDTDDEGVDREETAEEIAKTHGEMLEFGQAVKQLESAASSLRRNGHATVTALEGAEEAIENLKTVFAEYESMRKLGTDEWPEGEEVSGDV